MQTRVLQLIIKMANPQHNMKKHMVLVLVNMVQEQVVRELVGAHEKEAHQRTTSKSAREEGSSRYPPSLLPPQRQLASKLRLDTQNSTMEVSVRGCPPP